MISLGNIFSKNKQLLLFAMIGFINTSIHSVSVIGLVELSNLNPVIANTAAFLIANICSFLMNSKWTFSVTISWVRYSRFLAASIGALVLTIFCASLAEYMGWHYLMGLVLVIAVVPLITFLVYKKWAFDNP